MDRSRFCRAFKRATGRPPHSYVLEQRVQRASELLAGSRRPIAEVALAVGFSSQSHLTTAFRKITGATPHAYRLARRG
jgi:AraC family transcriptional regulator